MASPPPIKEVTRIVSGSDPREVKTYPVQDALVTRELLAIPPSGKRRAMLFATDTSVGLWIYEGRAGDEAGDHDPRADAPMACAWLDGQGAWLGVYGSAEPEGATTVAIGVLAQSGEPVLQMTSPKTGKVLQVTFDKLERLLGLLGEEGG